MGMSVEQTTATIEATSRAIAENIHAPAKPDYTAQILVGVSIILISGWIIYMSKRISRVRSTKEK